MRTFKISALGGVLGCGVGIAFALLDSSGSGNIEPAFIAFFAAIFVIFGALCGTAYAMATRGRVEADAIARKREARRKQPPKGPELAIGVVVVVGLVGVGAQINRMLNASTTNETDWLSAGVIMAWLVGSLFIINLLLVSHRNALQKFEAQKRDEDAESRSV